MKTQSVRDQLIEHTLVLIRRRGFNGFSYRDLAALVGVKTSSIHYYFPTKEDLALEAVKQYSARIAEEMRGIDESLPAAERARAYLKAWHVGFGSDQICLCNMLATETACLPQSIHEVLKDFYRQHEAWLTNLLEQAKAEGVCQLPVEADVFAKTIFGALQSGVVAARLFQGPERLDAACATLMAAVSR